MTRGELVVLVVACVAVGVSVHMLKAGYKPVACAAAPPSASVAPRPVASVAPSASAEDDELGVPGDYIHDVPSTFRYTRVYHELDAKCRAARPHADIQPTLTYFAAATQHDRIAVECWAGKVDKKTGMVGEGEFIWSRWAELP